MKRFLTVFLATFLVLAATTFPSGAKPENTPKEEIVYGVLDSSGTPTSITVVNEFVLMEDAYIADYGKYSSVENLSAEEEIVVSGSSISFKGGPGRVNYKGVLENRDLPWKIDISYQLNGNPIEAKELSGETGKLTLSIKTAINPIENESFYEDFSLQVTIPMKTDLCRNIRANGATVAGKGDAKQYSYVVLPGEDGNILLTADVTDFEMDSITFAGVRMNFELPLDIKAVNQNIDRLVEAASKLDGGAAKLVRGAKDLKAGISAYTDAFWTMNRNMPALKEGATSLTMGLSDLEDGLTALSNQGTGLLAGAQKIQQSAFDSANAQLAGTGIPTLTPENYRAVLTALPPNPTVDALIAQLDDVTSFVAGVASYTQGATALADGAVELHKGAGDLKNGIFTLADGLDRLYDGAVDLNSGMKSFLEGVAAYRAGTKTFEAGISQMDEDLAIQLDTVLTQLSDEGKIYPSYVSSENTNVNFVQFVIKADGIETESAPPAVEPKPAEKSLWEKFMDLFQ